MHLVYGKPESNQNNIPDLLLSGQIHIFQIQLMKSVYLRGAPLVCLPVKINVNINSV